MSWIAGYVLFSIALCLLTVAAHDTSAWLSKRAVTTWAVVIEYTLPATQPERDGRGNGR